MAKHRTHRTHSIAFERHNKNEAYLVLIVSSHFVGVSTQESS